MRVSPCSLIHINEHNHCLDDAATPEMVKRSKETREHQGNVGDKPDVNKRNNMQVKELYEEIIQHETADPGRVSTEAEVDESLTGAVWPGWQSGDRHPGPLIFKMKKKLRALFAKARGDNLHKLKYYSNNQGLAVICSCLIKEHQFESSTKPMAAFRKVLCPIRFSAKYVLFIDLH